MTIFENEIFRLSILNDKFYHVEIFNDVEFDIGHLKVLVAAQESSGLGSRPILIDPSETTVTSIELLSYLAIKDNSPYSKADAFIVRSISHRILAKLYQKLVPRQRPTGFFKSRDEALSWLEGYL